MPDESDPLFQEAVEALRGHDRARAKEILTGLLKTDQNNADVGIWLSAAVDTVKERIYCLQTAIKLDPENSTAKRGLILLGALPPEEHVQPFPINHPRDWEDRVLLANERPREQGLRVLLSNPLARLATIIVVGAVVVVVAVFALFSRRGTTLFSPAGPYSTEGPTPTFTLTPTFVNASPQPTATTAAPHPLAILFHVSYSPTPVYGRTPRSPLSADIYNAAKVDFARGNFDQFINSMNQIATTEPNSADVPYLICDAYRAKGDCHTASTYYNTSLQVNSNFAPAYLGLAQAKACTNPGSDATDLFQLAIKADPNYGDAYLALGNVLLDRNGFNAALPNLIKAGNLMPNSALVQLAIAHAYLLDVQHANALAAAQQVNSIDLTLL